MAEGAANLSLENTVRQATAAMRASDLASAYRIAKPALDAGLEHPFLLTIQGLWLHEREEHRDALRSFHHARTLAPEDPMILNGIAGTVLALGDPVAARRIVEVALSLSPDLPPTLYLLGRCLEETGAFRESAAVYRRVLAAQPQNPAALAGLASASVQAHDLTVARDAAERVLAKAPLDATGNVALALVEIHEGAGAEAEDRIGRLLKTDLPPRTRALAYGILGDARDSRGEAAGAFQAYSEKNRLMANVSKGPAAISAADNLLALHAHLMAAPAPWSESPASAREAAGAHVFLVGFPRSGTTLLEQILAAHPDVRTVEETDLLIAPALRYLGGANGIAALQSASEEDLAPIRNEYWAKAAGRPAPGKTLVDKLPTNTAKLPLIAKLFPQARILFAVRDPRDVVLSCFRRQFRAGPLQSEFLTLSKAADLYDATMRIGQWSQERLPLAFRFQRLEDLVDDFGGEARAICNFVRVAWDDAIEAFAQTAERRQIVSMSAPQVRRGLNAGGIGRWRMYAEELAPVLPALAPWVERFGYPPA